MIIKIILLSVTMAISSAGLLTDLIHLPISGISLSASAGPYRRDETPYPAPSFNYPPPPINYAPPTGSYPVSINPAQRPPTHLYPTGQYYDPLISYVTSSNAAPVARTFPVLAYTYSNKMSYGAASTVASAPTFFYQAPGVPPSPQLGAVSSAPIAPASFFPEHPQPIFAVQAPATSQGPTALPTTQSSSSTTVPVPSVSISSSTASGLPPQQTNLVSAPSASIPPVQAATLEPIPSASTFTVPVTSTSTSSVVIPQNPAVSAVPPAGGIQSSVPQVPTNSAVASSSLTREPPVPVHSAQASFRFTAPTEVSYVSSPTMVPAIRMRYGFGW